MDLREELKSAGTYPTGPVSAWPESRNFLLLGHGNNADAARAKMGVKREMPSAGKMFGSLVKTAGQAFANGKVSSEIREERYNTCKACPLFDPQSKRCTDCGCFMEAKSWVGGNPHTLCPQKKWVR